MIAAVNLPTMLFMVNWNIVGLLHYKKTGLSEGFKLCTGKDIKAYQITKGNLNSNVLSTVDWNDLKLDQIATQDVSTMRWPCITVDNVIKCNVYWTCLLPQGRMYWSDYVFKHINTSKQNIWLFPLYLLSFWICSRETKRYVS